MLLRVASSDTEVVSAIVQTHLYRIQTSVPYMFARGAVDIVFSSAIRTHFSLHACSLQCRQEHHGSRERSLMPISILAARKFCSIISMQRFWKKR